MEIEPRRDDWRDVLDSLAKRHSCRAFDGSAIARDVLADIVADGVEAPSSCNHQNWHFIVVDDRVMLERARQISGGNAHFETCSALIYLCFQKGYTHGNFSIVQSVAGACYHMMLSAHLRGYASIWNAGIGPHGPIREMLDLPETFELQGALAIGVPLPDAPTIKAPRRPVSEVFSWNGFTRPPQAQYPMKPAEEYPYFAIRNDHNPYAQWNPAHWTWDQIADFRGHAVWAKSPLAGVYVSRRQGEATAAELSLLGEVSGIIVDMMPWGGTATVELARMLDPDAALHVAELSDGNLTFIAERLRREDITDVSLDLMHGPNLPYADGSVDAVVMQQVLEHMPDPQAMLDEVARILRSEGACLVSVRNADSAYGTLWRDEESCAQVPNQGPFTPLPASTVRDWMAARFDITDEAGIGVKATGDAALSRSDILTRRLYVARGIKAR